MEKCNCYEEREQCTYNCPPTFKTYGVCLGTRECDRCFCGGDPAECDFYPEKRKEAEKIMNTAEMWLKAKEDGKVYECIDGDIAYSSSMGLVDKDHFYKPWGLEAWKGDKEMGLDNLMNCQWTIMDSVMTKAEAEKKFGIKIVG